jgi:Fe-Mn family superoxide dismutase
MPYELMDLPYGSGALAPHMSRETLEIHHGKHHRKYVDTLNELVAGTRLEGLPLEQVVLDSVSARHGSEIFNNAAQVWNHEQFWKSMSPNGGGMPGDRDLAGRIDDAFGSFDAFKTEFTDAATGLFGSGWTWLALDHGSLEIVTTPNAVPPFATGRHAILACDVWEHAYYVDFRNDRGAFVKTFLDELADWEFAARELRRAQTTAELLMPSRRDAMDSFLATGTA